MEKIEPETAETVQHGISHHQSTEVTPYAREIMEYILQLDQSFYEQNLVGNTSFPNS